MVTICTRACQNIIGWLGARCPANSYENAHPSRCKLCTPQQTRYTASLFHNALPPPWFLHYRCKGLRTAEWACVFRYYPNINKFLTPVFCHVHVNAAGAVCRHNPPAHGMFAVYRPADRSDSSYQHHGGGQPGPHRQYAPYVRAPAV